MISDRTWDFGGQREYYATHQYFLSKRSLYLVVWRIPDGQRGINEILHWLVNIQVGIYKLAYALDFRWAYQYSGSCLQTGSCIRF
jgi:GTPase SAR1 family protein